MKSSEILFAAAKLLEDGKEYYGCDALWNCCSDVTLFGYTSELFDQVFPYFQKYKPENPFDADGCGVGWWPTHASDYANEDGIRKWNGEYLIVPERVQAMKNAAQDALNAGD